MTIKKQVMIIAVNILSFAKKGFNFGYSKEFHNLKYSVTDSIQILLNFVPSGSFMFSVQWSSYCKGNPNHLWPIIYSRSITQTTVLGDQWALGFLYKEGDLI